MPSGTLLIAVLSPASPSLCRAARPDSFGHQRRFATASRSSLSPGWLIAGPGSDASSLGVGGSPIPARFSWRCAWGSQVDIETRRPKGRSFELDADGLNSLIG